MVHIKVSHSISCTICKNSAPNNVVILTVSLNMRHAHTIIFWGLFIGSYNSLCYTQISVSFVTRHLEASSIKHLSNPRLILLLSCTGSFGRTATNYGSEDTNSSHSPRTQLIRCASRSTFFADSVKRSSGKAGFHEEMQKYLSQCVKHHQILLEWVSPSISRTTALISECITLLSHPTFGFCKQLSCLFRILSQRCLYEFPVPVSGKGPPPPPVPIGKADIY